ncbi:MAG TPA: hypothetical protein VFL57_11975 [Bryobacteraceae bacterium]|nr:hypothetical protein [Bryobacteraceae bacterium]
MASSTNKKVHVQRFDRDPLLGFVSLPAGLTAEGVELLTQAGTAVRVPWTDIKAVHFVKDFEPERIAPERKMFIARPKTAGLWVRLIFRDNDLLEGILPNDLLQLEPWGFAVMPPDLSGNSQRLFVPRQALRELTVLGVVGSPLRSRPIPRKKPAAAAADQPGLFDALPPDRKAGGE